MSDGNRDQRDQMDAAKAYWRSQHSQSARIIPETEGGEQNYRYELAREILALRGIVSVFEFGCASGRNLRVLHEVDAHSGPPFLGLLAGIDMNPQSLAAGAASNPMVSVRQGDENTLAALPDGFYDVAFTVSVLDHIPDPQWRSVYDDLVRVARRAVFILEPTRDGGTVESLIEDAPPFTWYHNYTGHDHDLKLVRRLPMPTNHYSCGADYHLLRRDI